MGQTHMTIGTASWLGVAAVAAASPPGLGRMAVIAGAFISGAAALAPDIDTKRSMASQSFGLPTRMASWVIRKSCGGHRKITHSIAGTALFITGVLAACLALHWPPWVGMSMVCGWLSHEAADSLTEEGLPVLWPLTDEKLHALPYPMRIRTGLTKVKVRGHLRKRHTAEYWLVRPLSVLAVVVFCVLIAVGW